MSASNSSDSNNIYLSQLFERLSDADMLISFLGSIQFAIDQNFLPDTFFIDFVLMTRIHRHCQHIISVLTTELLKNYLLPHDLFRADHLYIRVLKEFMIQSLGNTLTLHLAPTITRLNASLSPHEIAECTTQLFKKLYDFRFPSETKAFFLTVASIITSRFPGHEQEGLSGIFFLRYLCPLVMTSPISFNIEPSGEYSKNSIQLAKLIQNLANGIPSSTKPEFLLVSIENQHLMEEFLQRLASATNIAGFEVPSTFFSNLALISSPSSQFTHLFIERVVKSPFLYHEHHQLLLHERWIFFSVSWRQFASELEISSVPSSSDSSCSPKSRKKRRWNSSLLYRPLRSASSKDLIPISRSSHVPPQPLVFQRRSSSSSLLTSPKSESSRSRLRLLISAANNILSSEKNNIQRNGQHILELLGMIAELFGELLNAPEYQNPNFPIRRVLFEFAQHVEEFVKALNLHAKLDDCIVQLKRLLCLIEELTISFKLLV